MSHLVLGRFLRLFSLGVGGIFQSRRQSAYANGMRGSLAALLLVVMLLPGLAQAQISCWMDEDSSVHLTRGLESIADRYRTRARALNPGSAPATPPPAENLPSLSPSLSPRERHEVIVYPPPPTRWEASRLSPSYACRSCKFEGIGGTAKVDEVRVLSLEVGGAEMRGPAVIQDSEM